jgi:hypothetical protein
MFTAILRGYSTGYSGQPSEILDALDQAFETRDEARQAAVAKWRPLRNSWEFVGRKIRVVDLNDLEWSYLAADCVMPTAK